MRTSWVIFALTVLAAGSQPCGAQATVCTGAGFAGTGSAAAAADAHPDQRPALLKLLPAGTKLEDLKPSPIPGIYQFTQRRRGELPHRGRQVFPRRQRVRHGDTGQSDRGHPRARAGRDDRRRARNRRW